MDIATLVSVLDQPHVAADQFHAWGLRDPHRAQQTLVELAETGLTLDLLALICEQLGKHLRALPDPDAALAGLRRFLLAVRSPLALAALFERDGATLPLLLKSLSLGSKSVQLLADDPETFDLLRQTEGQPAGSAELRAEISGEISLLADESRIAAALARFQQRQILRIAYAEVFGRQTFDATVRQLTALAEVTIDAALAAAQERVQEHHPPSRSFDARQQRCSVLAVGRLGSGEMDYARDLRLLLVYEQVGHDATTSKAVQEHFERVARQFTRLLTDVDDGGAAAGVQWMPLPDSQAACLAHSTLDAAYGFEAYGRTWHREELICARSVAGDRELGRSLLHRLEAWLFRRYLNAADETGIQALKRRTLLDARLHQDERANVACARGGLANIEATVRLLQLLFGGDQPQARAAGMLTAIAGLEAAGALTVEERTVLEETYATLRQIEHRQQYAGLQQPVELPPEIAMRLDRSWQTLHKLLASAFPDEPSPPREVELLLDPKPPDDEIRAALAPFGFADAREALKTLNDLAQEQIPFLSTRRCRHALAHILPQLLCGVAATPNPDLTLGNLARVSNSLGSKGVLWELFRALPPSLDLYVKLCAASPYLAGILTTNPGMIDELVDSLQLHQLPTLSEQAATLAELCRGAADTMPILHDFKNAQHLRIGVRDILAKEPIERTHESLADVAEICLGHVAKLEFERLVERFGAPTIGPGPHEGEPCRFVVLGLGKLGGREPNYHSNLDVVFLYEAEGTTQPLVRSRRDQRTTNNHFFSQLAQRILKEVTQLTPKGRLYTIDTLLRPIGVGGAIALSVVDFDQHFTTGAAPLWQWQTLCQARPVAGEPEIRAAVKKLIRQLLTSRQPAETDRAELLRTRQQLERDAAPLNLKRAAGGTLDVEFLVQLLQLEYAAANPTVLTPSTQLGLERLATVGALTVADAEQLGDGYRFLRRVESGLRLLETTPRHDLPADAQELGQLALLIGHSNPEKLRDRVVSIMAENRSAFERLCGAVYHANE